VPMVNQNQPDVTPKTVAKMRAKIAQGTALLMLFAAILACSSIEDVVGQRRGIPTPTVPLFSTATPGGRISVWLVTPTGQSDNPQGATATPFGEVVAPAATATAAFATLQAATATAGATISGPIYQPNDCPDTANPPPPPKPTGFGQYAERVGLYLSAGGAPTVLEALLRSWNAISEGAAVQADTDLTGDGVNEVIVRIYDPLYFQQGASSPGEMLIYGCSQKGYRLLYATGYTPSTMIPELRRVGDMNGDARAEVAFTQQTCTNGFCTQEMQIVTWNAALGTFVSVNSIPMEATNGKISVDDLDKDGILEVKITFEPNPDPAAGPPRRTWDIWDWDGQNYVLALSQADIATYRIHALHDGDVRFNQGNWREAIRAYDRVRDNTRLRSWPTIVNEDVMLRGYATYKKMVAYVAGRSIPNATKVLETLIAENPVGSAGQGYAALGQAFMDTYNQVKDRKKTCASILAVAASRPDLITTLNSYGMNNRSYGLIDLCPFVDR
jgi:hypothetical protein